MRAINTIVIHCSATKHERNDLDRDFIRKVHVEENGWSDIGYHWIIRRDGTVQKGRMLGRGGAHAKGYNKTSIGICLMGGLHDNGLPSEGIDFFTLEQQLSLAWMIEQTKQHFPIDTVVGHRELPNVKKACPCFSVQRWLVSMPAIVAKLEFSEYQPALEL